jgi:hypothetical protein
MCAEIIDLATRHRTPGADEPPRHQPTGLTTTAKNQRLRSERWEMWRKAAAATRYWHTLLRFTDAVFIAKMHYVNEVRAHAETSHQARWAIVNGYRDALGRQLLTPAPDMAIVNWKRRHLSKPYVGADKDAIAKAIAEDIAFLDAHQTGTSRANKLRKRVSGVSVLRDTRDEDGEELPDAS